MTEDKRTVHLILALAFACFALGVFAPMAYHLMGVTNGSDTVERGISMAGIFIAMLARTRTDVQPVTVENKPSDPVPTHDTPTPAEVDASAPAPAKKQEETGL